MRAVENGVWLPQVGDIQYRQNILRSTKRPYSQREAEGPLRAARWHKKKRENKDRVTAVKG